MCVCCKFKLETALNIQHRWNKQQNVHGLDEWINILIMTIYNVENIDNIQLGGK